MISSPSLFEEPWWLDICAPNHWCTEVIDSPYAEVRFTYTFRRRFKVFHEIGRPPLTPFLGLSIIRHSGAEVSKDLTLLSKAVPQFVERLPRHLRFKLNFHPQFSWWSPFMWEGFSQQTRYTYRLDNIQDLDSLWKKFNSNIKRNIKKSEKILTVVEDSDPEVLYRLFAKTMHHQGKRPGYKKSLLIALYNELSLRRKGTILVAEDAEGRPHAAILLVWHNDECYYLVGGTDPDLRQSGAMALLMWKGINLASNYAKIFDFEGSMQQGIDKFIRNFGAIPQPYYQIYK